MKLEIGERVIYRSLEWEVQDNSFEGHVELFGRGRLNRGKIVRAMYDMESIERATIPDIQWTLGSPRWNPLEWKALHDAYRLTLAHGRGSLSSVDWGRLVLEPYQLVPLQRVENLPFPRLLIADDTGLGKTAEAGLILFRLMQRRRSERILILSRSKPEPERWQQEMREKFGVEMKVINDGNDYARLRRQVPSHLNVFGYESRIIMSMHFAAQDHIASELRRGVRWDIVIIDEAHHVAERSGKKALAELSQIVAETSDALLLLTATPHDGKAESFASLIRLLDPYAVVDPDALDPTIVRPLIVRRLKTQVVKGDGTRFTRREIMPLDVEPFRTREEKALDRGIRSYTKLLRQRAEQLEKAGEKSRAMGVSFLETFLRKRLASSAYACRLSLVNRLGRLQSETLVTEDTEAPDDVSQLELAVEAETLPDGRTEAEVLQELVGVAERIKTGDEGKIKALIELVQQILDRPDEKVIVFTEFRDTLDMIFEAFKKRGWEPAVLVYHGGTPTHERQEIQRRFTEDPTARIFLGTDAASEGINLQKACSNLIHVEIPWNPNRYEQRNGRIDRYGQTRMPKVYLLTATRSIEQRMAQVVVQKLETIAEQLGSVSNVFPLTQKVNIDDFLNREAEDEHTIEQQAEQLDAELDQSIRETRQELETDQTSELIRGEQFGVAEMDAVVAELDAARRFAPDYDDVRDFLNIFFRAEDGELTETVEPGIFQIKVPPSVQQEAGIETIARATFSRDIAIEEKDRENRAEFLSPGHTLVRAAMRRARGWLFKDGFESRIGYRKIAPDGTAGFIFTFAARFVDGRGETIEERFEPVYIDLDGQPVGDSEFDLSVFADRRSPGNLTPTEQSALFKIIQPRFSDTQQAAIAEVHERAKVRLDQLVEGQERIMEDALMRLGVWKQASERRLQQRMQEAGLAGPVQQDLFGVVSRRLRRFRDEQELLLKQEKDKREEIRAMRHVRVDSIDLIGALVLVPEGMHV